jgi:hypothetical protein
LLWFLLIFRVGRRRGLRSARGGRVPMVMMAMARPLLRTQVGRRDRSMDLRIEQG